MLPRRGLRLDLIPRELHLSVVGFGGSALAMWVGAEPLAVFPLAFLVAVRVRIRRI
ncbi:hypothetical protein [Streptomyces sp. NPDC001292]|uniref:hypothetical protein n=1 Tax=Streptomyces sp. NPDC001292 TaxID=3364558 RepID=UPI0036C16A0E